MAPGNGKRLRDLTVHADLKKKVLTNPEKGNTIYLIPTEHIGKQNLVGKQENTNKKRGDAYEV